MAHVLITGGMGFLGRHLTRRILAETEHTITIVDNLVASKCDQGIINNSRVTFIEHDLTTWTPPESDRYDQIYHMASPIGPVRLLEYSGRIAQIIIGHLYQMAELAIAHDAKLMFMSTSELYGFHAKEGTVEDVPKIVPANYTVRLEYATAKLMGEIILKNLSRANSLRYNVARPYNIIGPEQNHKGGFVIPRFLKMALAGENITVYGDGAQIRTFTHVDDSMDGLMRIMESDVEGEIFNVGNPDNVVSIAELAYLVKDVTGTTSEVVFVDPQDLHGEHFEEAWDKIANADKLMTMVGWQPKWKLADILEQVVEIERANVA